MLETPDHIFLVDYQKRSWGLRQALTQDPKKSMRRIAVSTIAIAAATATDTRLSLIDVTEVDANRLRAAGLNEMCLQSVRAKLVSYGAPSSYLDGTVHLSPESMAQANRVYNATMRVLGPMSDRESVSQCVRGEHHCTWILEPIHRLCGNAPDEATFIATLRRDTTVWWMLRSMSAFLLPASRRRLGMLDGDVSTSRVSLVQSGSGAATIVQKVQETVTQLMSVFSSTSHLPSSLVGAHGTSLSGRRLGLWSSMGASTVATSSPSTRDIIRAIPTLYTEAERQAAERALTAVQRAFTEFTTSLYLELPPPQKIHAAAALNHNADAVYELFAYLKTTRLMHGIRIKMDFTDREVEDALAFASGDGTRFTAFAKALTSRLPASLGQTERDAMVRVLDAMQPLLRTLGVFVNWLREQ